MRKPWRHMTREEKDLYNLKKRRKYHSDAEYRAKRRAQALDAYYRNKGAAVRYK